MLTHDTEETVLRNAHMLQLQRPSKQVHEAFLGHFGNRHKSRPYPRLAGLSADLYDDEFRDDLVALRGQPDEDRLTTYLRNHFPGLFARSRSTDSLVGYLSEYRLKLVVGSINVILAAAMLFGSIYNLYFVNSEQRRLGLIAGYTIAFALCVSLLTNARRSEVFGACAAYAAVLVVFVSGNLGNES
jgi:hypothetical protein